jgi:hypothetical protein
MPYSSERLRDYLESMQEEDIAFENQAFKNLSPLC